MKFIADLHVHSKFSRATSKKLDFENLYISAQLKGISVVATGDFTHPGWFSEIKEKLTPAEDGLYKIKKTIAESLDIKIPASCRGNVRFMLVSEISNIYKKSGKTRKNHNLVFIPDLSIAEKFNSKLDRIGNIKSDGRPILGLDAKDLLETVLETSDKNFLIPAHIWTPWFSMLGSKSGFDSVEACFEELTPHIFAVETGLSSDPPMNWRVKCLENLTLVSNSDAHSPDKLGREANIFDTELSFSHIREAIETGDPETFLGTLEFYPEEGKYHLDGHRKCGIRSWPAETAAGGDMCPVCGKPMTLGVLYRVEELADKAAGSLPEKKQTFNSIIPLKEILSELLGVGPNTKKVAFQYNKIINRLGPELKILTTLPMEQINSVDLPFFSEAIKRVRNQKIDINPGYDGEFGNIRIFSSDEKDQMRTQKTLFNIPHKVKDKPSKAVDFKGESDNGGAYKKGIKKRGAPERKGSTILNEQQLKAVHHSRGPMIIVAGPGTGKTLTITHRIAYLIQHEKVDPANILALTFTNKAAGEMRHRLKKMLGKSSVIPQAATFHAFSIGILQQKENSFRVIDDNERRYFLKTAVDRLKQKGVTILFKTDMLIDRLIVEKQRINKPHDNPDLIQDPHEAVFQQVYAQYQQMLSLENLWDYEDIIANMVIRFEEDRRFKEKTQKKIAYLFVDEYQDINYAQYRIIKEIAPSDANICVIGDPDQSIYAFRGSDVRYFNRFVADYPGANIVGLNQNYRSAQTVLDASRQMIAAGGSCDTEELISHITGPETIYVTACRDETGEAVAVGKEIEKIIGGMGFYSIDFNKIGENHDKETNSFQDIAVLYRTGGQAEIFSEVFTRAGIPHQIASKADGVAEKNIYLLLSFLKILENSGSYIDIERVIQYSGRNGLGKKTISTWKQWAFDNGFTMEQALNNIKCFPVKNMKKERQIRFNRFVEKLESMRSKIVDLGVHGKIRYILDTSAILEKIASTEKSRQALDKFIEKSKQYKNTQLLIRDSALQTDIDRHESNVEKVSLMSMHASKGLEFPVVFICGCENGLIPFCRQGEKDQNEAEERRLLYVAMTRAKQALYLTYAKKRRSKGKNEHREPSKFIRDIDKKLKNYQKVIKSATNKNQQVQLELFH